MDMRKLLRGLSEAHSPDLVRAALIRSWAVSNEVALGNLKNGHAVSSFLCSEKKPAFGRISAQIQEHAGKLSLKDLERSFEHLIEEERQTKQGSFYTPNYIIDYLIRHSLKESTALGRLPCICDPACGSAGFLVRAAKHLEIQYRIAPERAVRECLAGVDNDPWAIEHAEALIELYLASRHVELPGPKPHLLCKDTLLTDAQELRTALGFSEGFEAVVTNPPYVKLQNLEPAYRQRLTDAYAEFVKGSFGLAPLFLIAGLRLTTKNGCMGAITQNNLFTSLPAATFVSFCRKGAAYAASLTSGITRFSKTPAPTRA